MLGLKQNGKCWDPTRQRWYNCEQTIQVGRRGVPRGNPGPPPCCLPPGCCLDCNTLESLVSCFRSGRYDDILGPVDQVLFTSQDYREFATSVLIAGGFCGFGFDFLNDTFTNGSNTFDCFRQPSPGYPGGGIEITNSGFNYPQVQCLTFRSANCPTIGVCFQVDAVPVPGFPGIIQPTVDPNKVFICLNPDAINNLNPTCVQCNQNRPCTYITYDLIWNQNLPTSRLYYSDIRIDSFTVNPVEVTFRLNHPADCCLPGTVSFDPASDLAPNFTAAGGPFVGPLTATQTVLDFVVNPPFAGVGTYFHTLNATVDCPCFSGVIQIPIRIEVF